MFDLREAAAALRLYLLGVMILAVATPALAQHDHAAGHSVYKGWRNQVGDSCCNGEDCGSLAPVEQRWSGRQLEVKVEGTWCPVYPWMTVKQGSSPDWSKSHACVWPNGGEELQPTCARLKCYKGRGGF